MRDKPRPIYVSLYGDAAVRISGAAQFIKGVEELTNNQGEREEAERIYLELVALNRRIWAAEQACRGRELEFRLADPEGFEARRLAAWSLT